VVRIGGKEPCGKPSAIGKWTFQTKKVRDEVLRHTDGDVLNVFAGQTHLSEYIHGAEIVRNDLNPEVDADLHEPAAALGEHFDDDSFDTVILDPPFDESQSDEHYEGRMPGAGMQKVREMARDVTRPGGCVIEFGWHLWSLADFYDGWERDDAILFRQGTPNRTPVLMTVDRRVNSSLGDW
jgi:hypothetical protein